MKRILYITQLYPADSAGGSYRTKTTIESLLAMGNVKIDCFCFRDKSLPIKEMRKKHLRIYSFNRSIVSQTALGAAFKLAIKSLLRLLPYRVYKFRDRGMKDQIKELYSAKRYNCVLLDFSSSLQYAELVSGPIYYLEHNIETDLVKRRLESAKGFLKLFWLLELIKTLKYEKDNLRKVDKIFAISNQDREDLKNLTETPTQVMPTFIHLPYLNASSNKNLKREVVFTGLLSWPENNQALRWFISQCWDRIQAEITEAKFIVIGANANKKLRLTMKRKEIDYRGYVTDLSKIYQSNPVAIAPVWGGSGIRMKILGYMSYGLATVTTSQGIKGIKKTGVMVADNADAFSKHVITLLKDQGRRRQLGAKARDFVKKEYSQKRLINFFKKQI